MSLDLIGSISTKPNLLKKHPKLILTKSGISKLNENSTISSTVLPVARNRPSIEPADAPDISSTSLS